MDNNFNEKYERICIPEWFNPNKVAFLSGVPFVSPEARLCRYINNILKSRTKEFYDKCWSSVLEDKEISFIDKKDIIFSIILKYIDYANSFFLPQDDISILLGFSLGTEVDIEGIILHIVNLIGIDHNQDYLLDILESASTSTIIDFFSCLNTYYTKSSSPPIQSRAINILGIHEGLLFKKR